MPIPINEDRLEKEAVQGDLGDLITGRKKGRKSPDEVTFFKAIGLAIEDVVVAQRAYQKVIREGQGQRVELF